MQDKRAHPRVPLVADVTCEVSGGASIVGRAKDISVGGMFIESETAVTFGTEVIIVLRLPNTKADARLARHHPLDQAGRLRRAVRAARRPRDPRHQRAFQVVSQAPSAPREFFEAYLPSWFGVNASGDVTSPGSLVFHVGPESYALRLDAGKLLVSRVQQRRRHPASLDLRRRTSRSSSAKPSRCSQSGASDRLLALRSLSLDAERAKTIRNVDGSVAFEITEGELVRTLLLSPGVAVAGSAAPRLHRAHRGGRLLGPLAR